VSYLAGHWSLSGYVILAAVVAAWHEIGLARLARRSAPGQARARRLRSLWFYAGLGVLVIAVASPIGFWAQDYFFVHMIQHLLLMFAAPSLIVAGAPWAALRAARPGGVPLAGAWSRPLRAAGSLLARPWVAVALFNAVMIFWHLPGPYDLAERHPAVRTWLMLGSFLAAGVLFWLQFIPSPPFRRRMPLLSSALALLGTNVIMIGIAMALSIFASRSLYPVYDHVPGVTLPPLADQQLGAAILWVCGDFWAMPTMIVIVRRLIATEGSMSAALEAMVGRGALGASPGAWGAWGRPRSGGLETLLAQPPSPPDAGP